MGSRGRSCQKVLRRRSVEHTFGVTTGMHICQDEVIAFMMTLPFIKAAWSWLMAKKAEGTMSDKLTQEEINRLATVSTDEEWDALCDDVKAKRGGRAYPSDWFEKVLASGGYLHQFQRRKGEVSSSGIQVR
jgi:hypothetical protein